MVARSTGSIRRGWLAAIVCIYAIASYFLERADGGDWATWNHVVGGLALAGYLRRYYRDQREVVLTGFMQIYTSVGLLLSAAIVSTGVLMFEVGQFGTQNGIFWVVVGFFIVGFEACGLGYHTADSVTIRPAVQRLSPKIERLLILSVTSITLLISAYVFVRYRGPMLLGLDRVTFWRTVAPSYLSFVPTLVIQSFFFAAYFFLSRTRHGWSTKLPAAIILGYVAAAVLVLGQKFSAFVVFMNAWFVLLPGVLPHFKIQPRHLLIFSGVLAMLGVSVVVSYVVMGREAAFVLARIALQAQVLWSVFDDKSHLSLWPQAWSCYLQCGQFDDGKDFISFAYLPHELYRFYAEGGTELSGWMPALPILTMGLFLALLIHLVVSFLLGFIQRKVVSALSRENLFYAFLLFKVHLSLTLWWFAGTSSAVRGMLAVILLIALYRAVFPSPQMSSPRAADPVES